MAFRVVFLERKPHTRTYPASPYRKLRFSGVRFSIFLGGSHCLEKTYLSWLKPIRKHGFFGTAEPVPFVRLLSASSHTDSYGLG